MGLLKPPFRVHIVRIRAVRLAAYSARVRHGRILSQSGSRFDSQVNQEQTAAESVLDVLGE